MNVVNSIKAIVILGLDGRRGMAQYYDEQLSSASMQFEKRLFAKTKTPKAKDEIIVLDGMLIVHKFIHELHVYVVGARNENPLILDGVLNCMVEVIKKSSEHESHDHRSRIILALDEICDSGVILELDPELVMKRIESQSHDDLESIGKRAARHFFGL